MGVTVGALIAAGWILNYGRNALAAAFHGADPVADAFFVAVHLPGLPRRLFADGDLGAAFMPLFTRRLPRNGRGAAWGFAGGVLSLAAPAVSHAERDGTDKTSRGAIQRRRRRFFNGPFRPAGMRCLTANGTLAPRKRPKRFIVAFSCV